MSRKYVGNLSKNEQLVLFNLVKYPNYSDRDIYNRIQMKQSTYSTIKKKLAEEGYYYTSYSPYLCKLGCEILAVWYFSLNRKTSTIDRLSVSRKTWLEASEVFTLISESNQAVALSTSKNITDHVNVSDRLVQLYEKNNFLDEINYVLFPFDASTLINYFDYAPLLNRIFEIESPGETLSEKNYDSMVFKCKVEDIDMSELEKKVYLGLMKYGGLSDSALSEKVGCSRQVIRRTKKKFLEGDLLIKKRIVGLEKLGFDILAMTHTKFNPNKTLDERKECIINVTNLRTPIFHIARDPESVMLTPFRNFEEFKHLHNEFVSFCAEHDTLKEEPVTFLLSLPRIHEIKWLVYEPLVRSILSGR